MSTLARPVPFSLVLAFLVGVVVLGARTAGPPGMDLALGPALQELWTAEKARVTGQRQAALVAAHNR
jgi:hypothetical protein